MSLFGAADVFQGQNAPHTPPPPPPLKNLSLISHNNESWHINSLPRKHPKNINQYGYRLNFDS